ncbi:MAG: YeeE/YedE thiosulfate transporter family protein [Bacillota bacterium]
MGNQDHITQNGFLSEKRWWQKDWPYWAGALGIALANIMLFAFSGKPWGITSTITNCSAKALQAMSFQPEGWHYFLKPSRAVELQYFDIFYSGLWVNLGVVSGVVISAILMGEFFPRKIRSKKQVWLALAGGFLMGFGARLAYGCNAGALLGGISSMSLHGWLFAVFTFLGAVVGSKFILRILR